MTPESIVVGLEQAKALKEAGWPQIDALYFWAVDEEVPVLYRSIDASAADIGCIAAPTASGILAKLPIGWEAMRNTDIEREDSYGVRVPTTGSQWVKLNEDTLANAAAACWIYLKVNNLL